MTQFASHRKNPRGGPRTPEGKAVSRANAITHGLSATTLLPKIFNVELIIKYHDALREEWCPATPTERVLVRELARHQAALEWIEQIELAVLRGGARQPLYLGLNFGNADEANDAIVAAAGTSDGVEKISRYRRHHERTFLRTLIALQDTKKNVQLRTITAADTRQSRFCSEEVCEAYLVNRLQQACFHCPHCEGQAATWLSARRLLQCRHCRYQVTARQGTVMAASRVPLLAWFRAIELLERNPQASLVELQAATKLGRQGTVRRMAQKIRAAQNSPNRTQLLAGLDMTLGHPDPNVSGGC